VVKKQRRHPCTANLQKSSARSRHSSDLAGQEARSGFHNLRRLVGFNDSRGQAFNLAATPPIDQTRRTVPCSRDPAFGIAVEEGTLLR